MDVQEIPAAQMALEPSAQRRGVSELPQDADRRAPAGEQLNRNPPDLNPTSRGLVQKGGAIIVAGHESRLQAFRPQGGHHGEGGFTGSTAARTDRGDEVEDLQGEETLAGAG